jgi:hypothetical protein
MIIGLGGDFKLKSRVTLSFSLTDFAFARFFKQQQTTPTILSKTYMRSPTPQEIGTAITTAISFDFSELSLHLPSL